MPIKNGSFIVLIFFIFLISCSKYDENISNVNSMRIDGSQYYILASFSEKEEKLVVIVIDKPEIQPKDVNISKLEFSDDKGKTKQLSKILLHVKNNPVVELIFWHGIYVVKNRKIYYHKGIISRKAVQNLHMRIPYPLEYPSNEADVLNAIYRYFDTSQTSELYYDWDNPDIQKNFELENLR